jgi:hypothetical protein
MMQAASHPRSCDLALTSPGLYAKHNPSKDLESVLYSHKRLFPSVNQDMATQMVVPDEGLATAFIVTSKRPLAGRKEKTCQS